MYYRQHRSEVVGLAFSPDGEFMYSADSQGSLALYNASEEDHNMIRVVCMYTLAQTTAQTHLELISVHPMLHLSEIRTSKVEIVNYSIAYHFKHIRQPHSTSTLFDLLCP